METQKVSDLTTIESAGITDYIPVLTDEIDNVVERISIENFINAGYFVEKIQEIVNSKIQEKYDIDYPIGSIYIGTMSQCPIPVGTWQFVAQDRVLQGAGSRGSVGATVNESLPNITGTLAVSHTTYTTDAYDGAFANVLEVTHNDMGSGNLGTMHRTIQFNASNSCATYQDNAPVQQDAYLVNIWERVA